MKFSKFVLTTTLTLAAFGAQAANLVTNGSFEDNIQDNGSWSISSSLTGWTGLPQIELRNNVAGIAQDGVNYVELDAYSNSGMKQSITGNGIFQLSFWYSARPGVGAGSNDLEFSFGNLSGSVLNGVAGGGTHNWLHYAGLVTLSGSSDLIFKAAGASDSYGGSLDNISVTAVPEPETYAMLLAGLGLMGTIARRRTNKQA